MISQLELVSIRQLYSTKYLIKKNPKSLPKHIEENLSHFLTFPTIDIVFEFPTAHQTTWNLFNNLFAIGLQQKIVLFSTIKL